jgi:hypothetical protein
MADRICGTTEYSKSKIGKRSASSGFGEASTRADSDRSWNAIQPMPDYALVLNAGSSSLKFSVYERLDEPDWRLSSRGQIEGIETSPRIAVKDVDGTILIDRRLAGEVQDIRTALGALAAWLRSEYGPATVLGVGHRVVHGASRYAGRKSVRRAHRILPARYVGAQVADGLRLLGDNGVDEIAD